METRPKESDSDVCQAIQSVSGKVVRRCGSVATHKKDGLALCHHHWTIRKSGAYDDYSEDGEHYGGWTETEDITEDSE